MLPAWSPGAGGGGGVSSYLINDIKSSDRLRFLELTKCSPIRANHDKFIWN